MPMTTPEVIVCLRVYGTYLLTHVIWFYTIHRVDDLPVYCYICYIKRYVIIAFFEHFDFESFFLIFVSEDWIVADEFYEIIKLLCFI